MVDSVGYTVLPLKVNPCREVHQFILQTAIIITFTITLHFVILVSAVLYTNIQQQSLIHFH